MLGFESLFPCQRKKTTELVVFFLSFGCGDLSPNICAEESAFAKGEISRLCIPPKAVSCHARRSYSLVVRAERFFCKSHPERQTLYFLHIITSILRKALQHSLFYAILIQKGGIAAINKVKYQTEFVRSHS